MIALALVVVAGVAWAVVTLVLPRGATAHPTGFVPTGSSPGQDAGQITTAFSQAWTSGNLGQAAHYTDSRPGAVRAHRLQGPTCTCGK